MPQNHDLSAEGSRRVADTSPLLVVVHSNCGHNVEQRESARDNVRRLQDNGLQARDNESQIGGNTLAVAGGRMGVGWWNYYGG